MQIDFETESNISFTKEGCAGIIKLSRPATLNALNHRMILALKRALNAWETDNDISCILIEGEGRAFSAGGDVVEIYHMKKSFFLSIFYR